MGEVKKDKIENLKMAIIYGKKEVDGVNKDGIMEKIYKEEEDTAHYFYMKDFLQTHFKDEQLVQDSLNQKRDVNSIFYEMQKLGHIVFAENTSNYRYKSGVFYMPNDISNKQKHTLRMLQEQLQKEDYNIIEFINLYRNKDDILMGNQKIGKADILDDFTKIEEPER